MKTFRLISVWMFVLGSVAAWASAQVDTGSILGTVRGPERRVLPGATVTLTHVQTGIATRATTDSRGNYEAVGLAIGTYTVTVSRSGFRTASRGNVDVRIQDRLRIDFSLEVGGATEAVVVTTEAPILQTQEGSLGQVIETKQIQELPVSGRSFVTLAALAPGAFQLGGDTNGNAGEEDTLIVNGMRASSVNYMLDGVDNNNNDSPGHPDHRAQPRRHRGVQGPDLELLGRVRAKRRRRHQHDDQSGNQQHEGDPLRVRPRGRARFPRLLCRPG